MSRSHASRKWESKSKKDEKKKQKEEDGKKRALREDWEAAELTSLEDCADARLKSQLQLVYDNDDLRSQYETAKATHGTVLIIDHGQPVTCLPGQLITKQQIAESVCVAVSGEIDGAVNFSADSITKAFLEATREFAEAVTATKGLNVMQRSKASHSASDGTSIQVGYHGGQHGKCWPALNASTAEHPELLSLAIRSAQFFWAILLAVDPVGCLEKIKLFIESGLPEVFAGTCLTTAGVSKDFQVAWHNDGNDEGLSLLMIVRMNGTGGDLALQLSDNSLILLSDSTVNAVVFPGAIMMHSTTSMTEASTRLGIGFQTHAKFLRMMASKGVLYASIAELNVLRSLPLDLCLRYGVRAGLASGGSLSLWNSRHKSLWEIALAMDGMTANTIIVGLRHLRFMYSLWNCAGRSEVLTSLKLKVRVWLRDGELIDAILLAANQSRYTIQRDGESESFVQFGDVIFFEMRGEEFRSEKLYRRAKHALIKADQNPIRVKVWWTKERKFFFGWRFQS